MKNFKRFVGLILAAATLVACSPPPESVESVEGVESVKFPSDAIILKVR